MKIKDAHRLSNRVRRTCWPENTFITVNYISDVEAQIEDDWEPVLSHEVVVWMNVYADGTKDYFDHRYDADRIGTSRNVARMSCVKLSGYYP